MNNLKVALVHDWLTNMGGAEKVVEYFMDIFPNAPIYTTMCDKNNLSNRYQQADIRASFLQKKVKKGKVNHQKYFPFMPMAFESFDLNEYEIVFSSSTSCAKGVITNPLTMHICYCNSPMRYAWEFYYDYIKDMSPIKAILVKYLINYMKIWDVASANRVDYFIANSENVANRIWKHYKRESIVIHPPADTEYFTPEDIDEDYFLVMSRLVPYKRIDLAVKAFNELGLPLVVIGGGPELDKLKSMAKDNIKFLGRQPDEIVKEHYAKCRAFIFPGEEDYGITPVEAQASGRPVIAFEKGGALETVVDGETGLFFKEQTAESLKEAIRKFDTMKFDKKAIRAHAEKFSIKVFENKIQTFIEEKYCEFKNTKHWVVK